MTTERQIKTRVTPMRWVGDAFEGKVSMIDQRELPLQQIWHTYTTASEMAEAIRSMVVRGAPAIGIAAAFGVVLGVRAWDEYPDEEQIDALFTMLAETRPTAVNLFWALERTRALLTESLAANKPLPEIVQQLFDTAYGIMRDDFERNLAMGMAGAELFEQNARILTHCNTGGLATGGYGTALGVIRAAHAQGKVERVWVDETRPYLQGARLTAWECLEDEIPATLITDSMAGYFMQSGQVDAVIVGADRIGRRGHAANKIGTYALSVLAKHHGIPFYVAAPLSSFDAKILEGEDIEIEQRSAREVTHVRDVAIAPSGIDVAHPAFDVTPPELITAIICERGVAYAPFEAQICDWLGVSKT